jgi:hypothetical protein
LTFRHGLFGIFDDFGPAKTSFVGKNHILSRTILRHLGVNMIVHLSGAAKKHFSDFVSPRPKINILEPYYDVGREGYSF